MDGTHPMQQSASVRLAALLGHAEPSPWTGAQERDYQDAMQQADAELNAVIARRRRSAA